MKKAKVRTFDDIKQSNKKTVTKGYRFLFIGDRYNELEANTKSDTGATVKIHIRAIIEAWSAIDRICNVGMPTRI